jgi:hypothetical protein
VDFLPLSHEVLQGGIEWLQTLESAKCGIFDWLTEQFAFESLNQPIEIASQLIKA